MKRKLLSITVLLTVLLLGVGFYTVLASSSGYDAYKEAVKETHKIESGIFNIDFSISNNGELLQELTMQSAFNLEEKRTLTTIDLNTPDDKLELQVNTEDNQVYIKNSTSDTTYVMESNRDSADVKEKHERFHNKELLSIAELVVDTLTRPLHESFVIGPENTISVNMTNEDLPTVIHAMGSYMVKKSFGSHANIEMTTNDYPFLTNNLKQVLPTITDEISFDEIKVDVQLTDAGLIKQQQAFFRITGNDEQGQSHNLTIKFNIGLENINETVVEPFNIDGKKLETFVPKKVHKFH